MEELIKKAHAYVRQLLTEGLSPDHFFHSLNHTLETVEAVRLISTHSGVDDKTLSLLILAALFHDTGHIHEYEGHEERSAQIARTFLENQNVSIKDINEVVHIILSTKLDHEPQNLSEMIMKDADLIHLGKKGSLKKGELLRREWAALLNRTYSDREWLQFDHEFYRNARYHTDYARMHFDEGRLNNLAKIEKRIERESMKTDESTKPIKTGEKKTSIEDTDSRKGKKVKLPDRGVETVFRTTSRNHLRLSAIADNKANTLISISALIISIVLSVLVDTLEVTPSLIVPTVFLLLTCVLTIIFATLSTKPKVTENTVTRDDVRNKKGNLLFFGNFYRMKLEDYKWGMNELMHDSEYLYGSLMQDIYFLGLVLSRKYKFLRFAYSTFMYGIIASVIAFLLALYVFAP